MADRVYLMLDIRNENLEQAVRILKQQPGVTCVDPLEGRPSVIVMVEATDRGNLAKLAVEALASVEMETAALSLMPVKARVTN